MDVAIVGSRNFNNYSFMRSNLLQHFNVDDIKCICSGGAKGADTLAEMFADEFNIPTKVFLADWAKHGKSAGFIRNVDIVDNADIVIAFWDGISKGTKHSIDLAKKKCKEVLIFNTQEV